MTDSACRPVVLAVRCSASRHMRIYGLVSQCRFITERILFRRLAVFVGGFDLHRGERIAAAGGDDSSGAVFSA